MKKDNINILLSNYAKTVLSPTQIDLKFVSGIYQSFNELLGVKNCIQIGSFARYTAIKPLHDLDILYIIGEWEDKNIIPDRVLNELAKKFKKEYNNPTNYEVEIVVQTHSVSFRYLKKSELVFAVDLVPALKKGLNEFRQSMFFVPEVIKKFRGENRAMFYSEALKNNTEIKWIKTDPFGYNEVARIINDSNKDFRKAVKIIKGWKNKCKELNDDFKLKSFHLEQLITRDYIENRKLDIFDSVFKLFSELKDNIQMPNIKDRADDTIFIDNYLNKLTPTQKDLIYQAIDAVLIKMESINEFTKGEDIIQSGFYKRFGSSEKFLFDQKIPVQTDERLTFKIDGFIEKFDGFRKYHASLKGSSGIVDTKNSIEFKVTENDTRADLVKWKIRNDNSSAEIRGEISDRRTAQNPEKTAYLGQHYAECYAIKDNVCIAKDKVYVIVRR